MSFGKNVLKLRKKNGLSQEQLGDKLNVSRQTISNWEVGETSPNLKQLKMLSEELNVSIDELLDRDYTASIVKPESESEETPQKTLTQQARSEPANPSVKEGPGSKKPETKNSSQKLNAWQVTLLVLGFPLWFSLLIATIAIILSAYIILWALVISLWAIFIAMLCISVYLLLTGNVTIITHAEPVGLAIIGMSMFCAGLSILIFFASKISTKAITLTTKKGAQWVHNNLSKKDTINE